METTITIADTERAPSKTFLALCVPLTDSFPEPTTALKLLREKALSLRDAATYFDSEFEGAFALRDAFGPSDLRVLESFLDASGAVLFVREGERLLLVFAWSMAEKLPGLGPLLRKVDAKQRGPIVSLAVRPRSGVVVVPSPELQAREAPKPKVTPAPPPLAAPLSAAVAPEPPPPPTEASSAAAKAAASRPAGRSLLPAAHRERPPPSESPLRAAPGPNSAPAPTPAPAADHPAAASSVPSAPSAPPAQAAALLRGPASPASPPVSPLREELPAPPRGGGLLAGAAVPRPGAISPLRADARAAPLLSGAPVSPLRSAVSPPAGGVPAGPPSPLRAGVAPSAGPVSPPRAPRPPVSPPSGRKRPRSPPGPTWEAAGVLRKVVGGLELVTAGGAVATVPSELIETHALSRDDALTALLTQAPPSPNGTRPLPRVLTVKSHTPKARRK